ncbi:hypothetical protein VTK26DRAFT_4295 [Humicola hyalothermophila]
MSKGGWAHSRIQHGHSGQVIGNGQACAFAWRQHNGAWLNHGHLWRWWFLSWFEFRHVHNVLLFTACVKRGQDNGIVLAIRMVHADEVLTLGISRIKGASAPRQEAHAYLANILTTLSTLAVATTHRICISGSPFLSTVPVPAPSASLSGPTFLTIPGAHLMQVMNCECASASTLTHLPCWLRSQHRSVLSSDTDSRNRPPGWNASPLTHRRRRWCSRA